MKKGIDGISRSDSLRELSEARKEIKKLKKKNKSLRSAIKEYDSLLDALTDQVMESVDHFIRESSMESFRKVIADRLEREVYCIKGQVEMEIEMEQHSCE